MIRQYTNERYDIWVDPIRNYTVSKEAVKDSQSIEVKVLHT